MLTAVAASPVVKALPLGNPLVLMTVVKGDHVTPTFATLRRAKSTLEAT